MVNAVFKLKIHVTPKKICCFIFMASMFFSLLFSVKADPSSEAAILSQGNIVYNQLIAPIPTPMPILTTGENLGAIPDDWGDYQYFGDVCFGKGPQITHVDNTVLHNGNVSVRIDTHVEGVDINLERELDTYGFSVKPGDHIVFRCWIKTESASNPSNNNNQHYGGARIGLEYFVNNGYYVDGYPGTEYHYDEEYGFVTWGTTTWTFRQWDVIVPATYYSKGYLPGGVTGTFSARQITGVFFWMQVMPYYEEGSAWFADAEIYINP